MYVYIYVYICIYMYIYVSELRAALDHDAGRSNQLAGSLFMHVLKGRGRGRELRDAELLYETNWWARVTDR